jgi:hypothetical protein
MTDLTEREKGFEAKFAHDEELKFRIEARGCKLLAAWVAGLLGIPEGEAMQNYARDMSKAELREGGTDEMMRIMRLDLEGKGLDPKTLHLDKKLSEFLDQARQQLMKAQV